MSIWFVFSLCINLTRDIRARITSYWNELDQGQAADWWMKHPTVSNTWIPTTWKYVVLCTTNCNMAVHDIVAR